MSTKKVMFSEDVISRLSQALEHVGVKEYGRNKKIAEKTGFNDTHISGIFNKKVTLTSKFIKGVCKEFLISEDFVLHGTGEIKVAPQLNDGRALDGSWRLGPDNLGVVSDDPAIHEIIKDLLRLPEVDRWEMAAKIKRAVADRLAS